MSKTKRIELLEQWVAELMGDVERLKGVEAQVVRLTALVLPLEEPSRADMDWAIQCIQGNQVELDGVDKKFVSDYADVSWGEQPTTMITNNKSYGNTGNR